jgi:hypothetical protein
MLPAYYNIDTDVFAVLKTFKSNLFPLVTCLNQFINRSIFGAYGRGG